jgi:queuine tRNA-ribosyltransferase
MYFRILARDHGSAARTGEIATGRGRIRTPAFMPVATRGTVRALSMRDVEEIGFDIILSNTYHLYLTPGIEVISRASGLHNFMNFRKPILTDSGGFQVFSLSDFCRVSDRGVEFRSPRDGSLHFFTPEAVLDMQKSIGSDIMMVLDQCTAYPVPEEAARDAADRTVEWARQSGRYWRDTFDREKQALFAIVQGGVYRHVREECAFRLRESDFPGYAVGGLSVGEPKEAYRETAEFTLGVLPSEKPRYMMGVGSPLEILWAVRHGTDLFDSAMPTRIARNGTVFTSGGRVNIKSAAYASDHSPLDERCGCYVCRCFSRSYLRHLYKAGEITALIYNTYHNLFFINSFMAGIRESITGGRFDALYDEWARVYQNEGAQEDLQK